MILKSKKNDFEDKTRESFSGRHLRLLNQGKSSESKFFYRIENQGELAKLGSSYLDDYRTGIRSFAFSSINYKASQQRTILGIASYFDHLFDMRILIVSDMLNRGIFEEIMEAKTQECVSLPETDMTITVNRFHHHFDLVDFTKMVTDISMIQPGEKFSSHLQSFLSSYDIILWDTPVIETNRNTSSLFYYSAPFFESVTLIVSPTVSRSKDFKTLENYFFSYGISIKGIIFDKYYEESAREEKRSWWPF